MILALAALIGEAHTNLTPVAVLDHLRVIVRQIIADCLMLQRERGWLIPMTRLRGIYADTVWPRFFRGLSSTKKKSDPEKFRVIERHGKGG
jgi:hypothetical protein